MTPAVAPSRIALVLDDAVVPAWVARALAEVIASASGRFVLVVFVGAPSERMPLPFRAYEALDRRVFGGSAEHDAPTDVASVLPETPRLRVERRSDDASGTLSPDDLKRIAECEPDAILDFSSRAPVADLPALAPLGLWRFDHDEARGRGRPSFVWEMIRGRPVAETCLRATTATGSRVLERSFAAVDPVSLQRTRNAALWKSAAFPDRALRRIASGVAAATTNATDEPDETPRRAPNFFELSRHAVRAGLRVLRERRRRRREDFLWFIAVRQARGSWVGGDLDGFRPLEPPPGHFQADPFLVHADGRCWLFYEEARLSDGRGWICCREVGPDGRPGEARTVLERDGHLSYPFVFRHGSDWYLIPESSSDRTVELWRATEFPWRWELDRVLFEGVSAVDTTLFEADGRLWLFTAASPTGGSKNDELFLYWADAPQGPWTPHPANPIVSDVRRARPAGRLFREGDGLYRPAQDCSGEYGSGIWIQRVDRLDTAGYRETPVRRIGPEWWPGGRCTHTIDRAGGLEAIDLRAWFAKGTRPRA